MKVEQVSALHREAMEYTDESFVARGLNERDEYLRLTRLAFEKERSAADLLANEKVEPSRAILHRSAATLAYRCEKHEEAKRLIHRALAGSPPRDIEVELIELLGKVNLALANSSKGSTVVRAVGGKWQQVNDSDSSQPVEAITAIPRVSE